MANILDKDPYSFSIALKELGLPREEEAKLRRQYQEYHSPFSGIKAAVAPEEDRNTSYFFPVSVPEGKSIAEGITSGDWEWAIPEGLSESITTAAEGLEAPGQILRGVPYSKDELQDAAFKTAGTAGVGSLAAPVPDGATRMFGGMRARNFPWDRYDEYSNQKYVAEVTGKKFDEDIAWEDLGIEDNPEGAVFQIDPAGAVARLPIDIEKNLESLVINQDKVNFDMDEVFKFPELFDNYPVLKNFRVSVRDKDQQGKPLKRGGWFDATKNEIVVGVQTAKDPEEFRSVMLHELQHGVQAVEGTSGGAAIHYFFREDPKTGDWVTGVDDLREPVRKLNLLKDRVIDADINYGKESDTYKELWGQYVEDYRNIYRVAANKYMTNSGEVQARAAQLWDQLSTGEKKTTRPSSIEKQALGLLKKEYGNTYMPTATLSNTYAEGGMVQGTKMDNDMKRLFAKGGLNTGEAKVDPVSGNEVPPGSMPEEVRDDIDAKLSGGEYVVPADVLRFYGVSFFEKLRKKAKQGLAEMDSEGRIGGDEPKEMEEEDDDLPFGDDELMFEDDGEEPAFAAGGIVSTTPPGGIKTFKPEDYYAGFSTFGNAPNLPATPATPTTSAPTTPVIPGVAPMTQMVTYTNAAGETMQVQVINGQPQVQIPPGFYPTEPLQGPKPPAPKQESWADKESMRQATNLNPTAGNSETRSNAPSWSEGQDWSNMSPEEATNLASERLAGNKMLSAGSQALGIISPLAGMAATAATNLRPYAEANAIEQVLRAQGNTAAADAVAAMTDKELENEKFGIKALEPVLANGTMIAKSILGSTGGEGYTRSNPYSSTKEGQAALKGQSTIGVKGSSGSESSSDKSGGTKDLDPNRSVGQEKHASGSLSGSKTSSTSSKSTSTSSKTSSGGSSASSRSGGAYKAGGLVKKRKK